MSRTRSFLLFAAAAATWAGALGAPSQAASSFGVEIKNTAYNPKEVRVSVGDTVTWTNLDDLEHTVTFDDGFDSSPQCPGLLGGTPCMKKGQSASRLFTTAGPYKYHCRIHASMTGTVTVESVTASTSPSVGSTTSTTGGGTSASSTTSTTLRATTTTSTTRVVETRPTVLRSTTTTVGVAYTPVPQGEAPAFDPDRNEDVSPVPDTDEAAERVGESEGGESAAGDSGGDSDSGGAAVVVVLLVLAAGGGGALLWKFRPKRA